MFDNILKKAMKKGHDTQTNKFKDFKPKKQFTISDKKVQVFNNNPIPKKSIIKKVYDKIPDDTSIPLQFMTRKQYMNKYIKNQEHINGIDYPTKQEKNFIKKRTPHYANITGRYTTRNNPYYPPAVVVFNDKNNFKNIKGKNFGKLAWHEYGHELVEKENIKLTLPKEEHFADRVADIGTAKGPFCDNKAKNQIMNEMFRERVDKPNRVQNVMMPNIDYESKDMATFPIEQEKEIYSVDWEKNQKGKKIGEGHYGEVFEVKDNPKYVLKVSKNKFGSYEGSNEQEYNKYDENRNANLIAPTIKTKQGLVRENLNIVSRGITKKDWDANKQKKDNKLKGLTYFENSNLTDSQVKQVVSGVNELSESGVLIDDELQIGVSPTDNKPYLYDIGTLRKQKENNYDNYARDENDQYKERFLKGVNKEKYFDRDYEKESEEAVKEIERVNIDYESKNKFTANQSYEGADELTAAQKFGGRNLQGLKKIGQGRDRVVYALDDDKVLKVSKNPGGLTQNTGEGDLEYLGMGKQLEHGKDYVVMQRQQPLSKEGKRKLAMVRKEVSENTNIISPSYRTDVASSLSGDDSVLDKTGIGKDILDFQPNPQEVFANHQWGENEQGELVLVDGGALQDNQSLSKYRVKDYKSDDWQYKDWQDIKEQRKQFKDKGSYDKERKFNKGYMQADLDNNVILDDNYSENKFKFWNKKQETEPQAEPQIQNYPDITNQEFRNELEYRQRLQDDSYGEVKDYSGNQVGNTMITADIVIPSGKLLSVAGLGVKKYVDKVKLIKTDEHDNKYKVPRIELHKKMPVNDDYSYNKQVLWHAGDIPPSETLKKEGRVYGFSGLQFAQGWKKAHDKSNIYQFVTDDYDLDTQLYSRKTDKGTSMSDNEYIAYDVQNENVIDIDTESKDKNKIIYRNESFPGYNIPKPYKGTQKYKFRVLAKDKDRIGIVNFGHSDYEDYTIHKDKERRKNFRARHNCDPVSKLDKLSARYWSCQYLWQ